MDVIFDWNLGNKIYHGLITLRLCGFPFTEIGVVSPGVPPDSGGRGERGRQATASGGKGEREREVGERPVGCGFGARCSVGEAKFWVFALSTVQEWVFILGVCCWVRLRGLNNVVSCGYGSQLLLGIVFVLWPMVF
jgi:hypothetical protein